MGKIHLDRLKKRHGYKGGSLAKLTQKIIAQNNENIANGLARKSQEFWKSQLKRVQTKPRQFSVPTLSDIIPKRAVFSSKAAVNGKLITDTLRDKMTRTLRQTIADFEDKGEALRITSRRDGKVRQAINPKLAKEFEARLRKVFTNYTKRDKRLGVPKNVSTIAVTEMRSTINGAKETFARELAKQNKKEMTVQKRWIHNSSLSKTPENIRKGHQAKDFKTIPLSKKFRVRNDAEGGVDSMDRPHDPSAPISQVANCHCDIVFIAKTKGKKSKKSVEGPSLTAFPVSVTIGG